MIDINDVYAYLSENEPETAQNLLYYSEMLKTCLDEAVSTLKNRMKMAIDNDDYDEIDRLKIYRVKLNEYKEQIDEYLDYNTDSNISLVHENISEKSSVDYSEYAVDRDIKHSLDEDFTYKRISGFMLEETKYIADNWQDALVKICALLAQKSGVLFRKMMSSEEFKGKKRKIFYQESIAKINKKIPDTDYYVLVNINANSIVKIIGKMLLYFEISPSSFYVYLRADYTGLHKDVGKLQ